MNKWIIVDTPYLCHRAFFSTGSLTGGTLFGFFNTLTTLRQSLKADKWVFCFEGDGKPLRTEISSIYKQERRTKEKHLSPDEAADRKRMRGDIKLLRDVYLPQIGFKNIWHQDGYEADDCIASCAERLCKKGKDSIIVSGDNDLFQLLGKRVIMWIPAKSRIYTEKDLSRDYDGISPEQWAQVKALAGCASDGVRGIEGVGEITAVKFLRGKLNGGQKIHDRIIEQKNVWLNNLQLVKLPYHGCKEHKLYIDCVTPKSWDKFCKSMGFSSLIGRWK